MDALPRSFRMTSRRADAAIRRDMMARYVASVRADVLTPETPEAQTYMDETGGTFADFVHDQGFTCAILGVPFRWDEGIDTPYGRAHRDARFIAESF